MTQTDTRTGSRWRRTRARVIRRDRGICHICGQPGADSADHLIPVTKGGALYDLRNLRAAHHNVFPNCNRVRGDRPITQARALVAARVARAQAESVDRTALSEWEW